MKTNNKLSFATSYEGRVSNLKVPEDITKQIELAKAHLKLLRLKASKPMSLDNKLAALSLVKEAEWVIMQLRVNFFVLEDALKTNSQKGT